MQHEKSGGGKRVTGTHACLDASFTSELLYFHSAWPCVLCGANQNVSNWRRKMSYLRLQT